jgi:hypothetical protein
MVDGLQEQVKALNAQVLQLEREKAEAYKTGYDSAFAKYEDINERYIALFTATAEGRVQGAEVADLRVVHGGGRRAGAQIP